ncbi:ATP-binding cassette domain-containing protein [Ferrimonas senticii]|uniref:ATP-binding cassette domain-containing protein n=1 Tax=Ferrimonas senticii TaxID=394566 RepID=UPI0003FF6462|nr:ATP-binding cassette domain-containing protein [Ferrimonas senticii]
MVNHTAETVLTVNDLTLHLEQRLLLNNVNFSANAGEFIAILGANGVGKSTLFDCLLGHRAADSGQVQLRQQPLQQLSIAERAQQIALVPQQQEGVFAFSGLDTVLMGRTPYLSAFACPSDDDRQLALAMLRRLNASHLAEREFNQLSGGEKQLLLLARAMVQSQHLLLLDEPTNHLDYHNRYHMLDQVKLACRRDQLCAIAILHDPNLAYRYADKVLLLDHGRCLGFGAPAQVMTPANLSALYGMATAAIAIGQQQIFMPQHLTEQTQPRVLLLTGESGSGKTTALMNLWQQQPQLQLKGLLCPGEMADGKRLSSDAINLASGERQPFGRRQAQFDAATGTRFSFAPEGLALAQQALNAASDDHSTYLVDEIGPMELAGLGLAKAIASLLANPQRKQIWVVRPSLLEAVIERWHLQAPQIVVASDADAASQLLEFCAND